MLSGIRLMELQFFLALPGVVSIDFSPRRYRSMLGSLGLERSVAISDAAVVVAATGVRVGIGVAVGVGTGV